MLKRYKIVLLIFIAILSVWLHQYSAVIAAPNQQGQDIAVITEPANNAVVRGSVPVMGSADHPSFQFYILEFHPEPVTNERWQIIGAIQEAPALNTVLQTWDTSLIPDGSYTLRLRVVRLDGNYSEGFSQQVVVANSQPISTDTPAAAPIEEVTPTVTPTSLPPTPTIVIDQPIVDTPTPRPVETSAPLADPAEDSGSFIPTVTGFSVSPLITACLYGAGLMLAVFLLFGFLSALRAFIKGFMDRRRFKG